MSLHFGTHVDAPNHFIPGAAGVDELAWEGLIGWARVVHVGSDTTCIGAVHLSGLPKRDQARILLFRTANGEKVSQQFAEDYVALDESAASEIATRGYRGVGIDYLSIEPYGNKDPIVHHILLRSGIAIIEGLDLRNAPEGIWWFTCLPLALPGADAAPARALLWV